jgi:hypothetical protein
VAEKTDYSPSSRGRRRRKHRQRRKWATLLGGAHLFWIYALILAGIVVLLYYVLR